MASTLLTATRRYFRFFLFTIVTLLFVVFAVANRHVIVVSLFPLPYEMQIPLFLLSLICFVTGLLAGWLLFGVRLHKVHKRFKSEHKRVMALENEVAGLHANYSIPTPSLPRP